MARTEPVPPKVRRRFWVAFALLNAVLVILFLAAIEWLIVLALNHPPPIHLVRRMLSGYYYNFDRAIVQMLPDCARYDSELGYTLRPGTCRFRNRDFDTEIRVNSKGLRDNEDSLWAPEIIVLGDSFAMGWGVEGPETFAKQLEGMCGMKVLNAGISSYGTAREVRLLDRLDRSAVKWVVVQYSDNDYGENLKFRESGNRVVAMSAQDYWRIQELEVSRKSYYPGKHLNQFIAHIKHLLVSGAGLAAPAPPVTDHKASHAQPDTEAGAFLDVLATAAPLPAGASVVALEINGSSRNDGAFAAELQGARAERLEPWRSMHVLDPAPLLSLDHFLPLDEHLSASGHRVVAEYIARSIGCVPTAAN